MIRHFTRAGLVVFSSILFTSSGILTVSAEETAVTVPAMTSAPSVTLDALIREGMDKSPALSAKRSEYEAARSRVINAWLPGDPMVGVDVEGQPDWFKTGGRMDYEYMAEQTIPFPTKLYLNGVIASKEAEGIYQTYKEEERAVAWRIEQPSYQFFLAKRTLAVLRENKALLDQFSNIVKARYESNAANQTDLLKVQIEAAQTSIEIFDWEQKVRVAQAAVSRQLNRPPDTEYTVEENPKREMLALSVSDVEKITLEKRSELKSLEIALERARASNVLARTDWLPDITGRFRARKFKGEDQIREYDNFIGFSVPVWSLLKGIGGGWRAAEEDVRSAEALYKDMKNEALFKAREAYTTLRTAENAIKTYEELILPQAKQQVEILLSGYEAGKTDVLNLIDGQRTLRTNQMGYYKAVSEYEIALSDLRLAAGDDLGAVTAGKTGASK